MTIIINLTNFHNSHKNFRMLLTNLVDSLKNLVILRISLGALSIEEEQ